MAAVTLVLAIASASAIAGTVSCDSYNGGRNTCSADTRNGVALARQVSWNKCKKGVSWGVVDDNRIWVDQGCRGILPTGVGWSNGGGGSQKLTCAPYNNRKTECPQHWRPGQDDPPMEQRPIHPGRQLGLQQPDDVGRSRLPRRLRVG